MVKICHRDIKPANVFIFTDADGNETYKIGDFGTSKILEDEDLTQTRIGTPLYIGPEIYKG